MPSFDIDKPIAEDERNRALDLPFRYGYAFEVNYNTPSLQYSITPILH